MTASRCRLGWASRSVFSIHYVHLVLGSPRDADGGALQEDNVDPDVFRLRVETASVLNGPTNHVAVSCRVSRVCGLAVVCIKGKPMHTSMPTLITCPSSTRYLIIAELLHRCCSSVVLANTSGQLLGNLISRMQFGLLGTAAPAQADVGQLNTVTMSSLNYDGQCIRPDCSRKKLEGKKLLWKFVYVSIIQMTP